jgi:prepilin-type processing-associated H-X9-DG protein
LKAVWFTMSSMLYEGKDGKLNFKHDGKAAVAFADGHAKLVTEEEAKTLIWKLPPPAKKPVAAGHRKS